MVNHHGTQSGFHPSPPRRQPLCCGGASQEQLWKHTQRGQQGPEMFPARHILQGWCTEAMPPSCRCPAEHARGDATSPGGLPTPGLQQRRIFFPTTTMGNQPHGCCGLPNLLAHCAGTAQPRRDSQLGQMHPSKAEPITNVPWASKEVTTVERRTRMSPGTPPPPCTSLNFTPQPAPCTLCCPGELRCPHSQIHRHGDRPAPGAAPRCLAGKRGCVLPLRGGGYGLRSLKCQTTRRSLEIHLSPLPLGAAGAGRLWR